MSESAFETGVSLWCDVMSFAEEGFRVSYEMELDSDDFTHFALQLRKYWSQPFQEAAKKVQGDTKICVATPKPPEIDFGGECCDCDREISNEEIHFEVIGDEKFLMICKDCFFRSPFGGG